MHFTDLKVVSVGIAVFLLVLWAVWPWIIKKRLTSLEVRAHDAADALIEIDEVFTALKSDNKSIPPELIAAWIKAKTAGGYLKRFLDTGR